MGSRTDLPRAVFDTNVYVSVFAFPEKPMGQLLQLAVQGRFELVVCPVMLDEFKGVAARKFHFSPKQVKVFEQLILKAATLIRPAGDLQVTAILT